MRSLHEHVDEYLRLRGALGFKLEREGRLLPQLVRVSVLPCKLTMSV